MNKFVLLLHILKETKSLITIKMVIKEILRRLYSNESFFCLQYDLTQDLVLPDVPFQLTVKKLPRDDFKKINIFYPGITSEELKRAIERLQFFTTEIPTCYAAYTTDGLPRALCWMIDSSDNDLIQSYFKGNVLDLKSSEVLCEFIYTHPDYRGSEIMSFLTLHLFSIAKEQGQKRAVAYVRSGNVGSLQGSKRIGWQSYGIKQVRFRLFKRYVTYKYTFAGQRDINGSDSIMVH